mmetsp:Transcript_7956/g.16968  ORF Transcript_7956/g.16968 Transcript_7956/m.16968 type:complete len:109 (-) Transcript_7956:103-429(-)
MKRFLRYWVTDRDPVSKKSTTHVFLDRDLPQQAYPKRSAAPTATLLYQSSSGFSWLYYFQMDFDGCSDSLTLRVILAWNASGASDDSAPWILYPSVVIVHLGYFMQVW